MTVILTKKRPLAKCAGEGLGVRISSDKSMPPIIPPLFGALGPLAVLASECLLSAGALSPAAYAIRLRPAHSAPPSTSEVTVA